MAFGFFKRKRRAAEAELVELAPEPAAEPEPEAVLPPEPEAVLPPEPEAVLPPEPEAVLPPEPIGEPIVVSRTLVKSQPELVELVASVDELTRAGVSVGLAEKGFGTRVEITAAPEAQLGEDELMRILDDLAEAQRRPFING